MIAIPGAVSVFSSQSKFDAFLYAPVGDDSSGHPLSVLSVFGRLDLDPWQEADSLARLPARQATQRLAALLPHSALPGMISTDIAARLVALLPPMQSRMIGTCGAISDDYAMSSNATIIFGVVAVVVLVTLGALADFNGAKGTNPPNRPAPASVSDRMAVPGMD